jgi:drug/metabolite transporter (DMT)-like permease
VIGWSPFESIPPVKPLLGILLKVISAIAFTIMAASLKLVSARYPTGELVFFRSFFALIPLLAWLGWQGDLINAVRTHNFVGHLKRGAFGSAGMFSGFVALSYLPLHDAIAIGYATPLIVVVLAAVVLKETVRAYRWTAVAFGFIGVLIMLSPHLGATTGTLEMTGASATGALVALFGACCSAGATIQVRRLTASEKTGAIVLYFSLLTTVLGLITIVFGWRMPSLEDFLLFVLIGIMGGIGQILLTQCYRYADTSIIAPFEYTTMIWALLFGWFVFGELPTAPVLIGAAIVAGAGVFVLLRERKLGLQRKNELESAAQRPGGG